MFYPSRYKYFGDKEPSIITWQELLAETISTQNIVYRNTIASRKARAEGNDKEANRLKASCGLFTPCCQCHDDRKEENIIGLTQVGMGDIDHIPAEALPDAIAKVKADPHTLFAFITNSQQGIRFLFRWKVSGEFRVQSSEFRVLGVEYALHRAAWEVGTRYYAALTGFPTDKSCKDAARVSFFCHDPEAYLNEDCEPFVLTAEDVAPYLKNPKQVSPTDEAHAAPVKQKEILQSVIMDEFRFRVDEALITRLLDKHPYQSPGRHQFWLKLGFHLRFFQHSRYEFDAYKQAALRILNERGLVLNDDPSQRKPHEIEDCLEYGFSKGTDASEDWVEEYTQRFLSSADTSHVEGECATAPAQAEGEDGDEAVIEKHCPHFPQEVYQNLPEQLWQGLMPAENKKGRLTDILLMSLLTNYSAICANTHLLYGTRDYSPNLGFICLAGAGNGKSILEYGFRIVKGVDDYLEKQSAEARQQYEQQKEAYELGKAQALANIRNQRKGAGSKVSEIAGATGKEAADLHAPEEPQDKLLVMPGTTSRSQFTICMHSMGEYGLIINSTEIRTICSTLKLDVGDFSDLLCKAMSNEQIEQFFKVDNRRIKIDCPKLSICMSGTFDQFHDFIRTIEDGLYSRFLFMMMEPHVSWISQKPNSTHGDYGNVFAALADDALQMWEMLQQCPTWVTFSDEQWGEHDRLWSNALNELVLEGGDDRVSIVNRHGLAHMRIATVLTVLRKWNEYKRIRESLNHHATCHQHMATTHDKLLENFSAKYRIMTCRDDDFQTASLIATTLIQHALHLSTTVGQATPRNVLPMRQWPWAMQCLNDMREEFKTSVFVERAEKVYNRSRGHIFKALKHLVKQKHIHKLRQGVYTKMSSERA